LTNQEHVVAKKAKKRVRREYTKAEEKGLRAHSKVRTPVKKIAKLTKRTETALRSKASSMGMRLGHKR
jgi:hypothetical protein